MGRRRRASTGRTDAPPASASRFPSAWDSPGFLLWHATLRWQREMAAALRPMGLTHVQFVLLASTWWLAAEGRRPNQRELADHAGTNVMMTSQVVRSLEARRLLRRESDAEDTRALQLEVTPEGEALVLRALKAVEDADKRYFSSVEDQERLLGALRRMAGRSPTGAPLARDRTGAR
jgi:DNA-binding MarR family transcriptional regulator